MATTPILNLPVAIGVDNTYWVPTASTNGSPTERVNVSILSGAQQPLDTISHTQGAILFRGASLWEGLDPGTAGYVLATQGSGANPHWVPNTAGSVTSVGLSLPGSLFSISGSPVTSSGTLAGDLIVQGANQVFAGPATGSDAVPTFRSLVNADISGIGQALTKTDDSNVTMTLGGSASTALVNAASLTLGWSGQLSVERGGTGLTSGTSGGILGFTASGTVASSVALTANALVRGGGAGSTPVPSAVSEDGSGNLTGVTTINGSSPHARLRTINPMGQYSQAGLASTSNGNYTGFDQWYALTQSNPITPSQLTLVEDGTPYMMRFTQDNASAQRYGVAQPFEFSFVNDLRGKAVSLSARVRMSAATTLRYAIVEWTGTANSLTKNIVNNWSSSTYTPGNFFISSNTTITATGSTALASNTLTTITLSGTVSSSMNNIIVFFWTDSAQAQNVTLDISNVWFGEGTAPSIFEPIASDDDFRKCLRYVQIITPGTTLPVGFGYVPGGTSPRIMVPICVAMRATPSASMVGGTGITGTQCLTYSGGGGTAPTAMSVNSSDSAHVWFVLTVTGMASGSLTNWAWSGGSAGSLVLDARL